MRLLPVASPLVACLLLVAVGCADGPEAPAAGDGLLDDAPAAFKDDLDRRIVLASPPERILTLAPNLTELAFAAGAGSLLPAASTADTYPPRVDSLPRFGLLPLDTEAIVALEPDLLLATTQVNTAESVAPLEALGIPTYFFAFEQLGDVPRALRTLDTLVGTTGGEQAAAAFERRVAAFRALTAPFETRPSVLLLVGDDTLYAFGSASYTQQLIRLAGGYSVTADLDGQQAILSDEFVLRADPDVIVVLAGTNYDPAGLVEAHPAFATLTAVQADRVFGLDPDLVSRPGPRLVQGLDTLLGRLHPGLEEVLTPHASSMPDGGAAP